MKEILNLLKYHNNQLNKFNNKQHLQEILEVLLILNPKLTPRLNQHSKFLEAMLHLFNNNNKNNLSNNNKHNNSHSNNKNNHNNNNQAKQTNFREIKNKKILNIILSKVSLQYFNLILGLSLIYN